LPLANMPLYYKLIFKFSVFISILKSPMCVYELLT
jgi:hypothetical protein